MTQTKDKPVTYATLRPITGIKPYGKNAKKHPDDQVLMIANSIKEFGFNQPIVVDKEGVIIVGHGRYLAAHFLGMDQVPVLELDLDEEKVKAYRLADNKLNESDWDMQLVIQELKDLSMPMLDLTGFDRKLVLNTDEKDDDVPEVPETPKSKRGDIYQLGNHFLLCGDSTDETDFNRLMSNVKADMVFTDPPYNISYSRGKGENTKGTIMNDKMDDAVFLIFLTDAFKRMKEHVKGGAGLYVFHSQKTQKVFEEALNLNGLSVKSQLIWNKPNAGMHDRDYAIKHEPFFYACVDGTKPLFYGDRTHTTVVDFHKTDDELARWAKKVKAAEKEGRTTIWTMKRAPLHEYVHPTQKPVELVMYALHNSSKVDDIVLDPFLGSGSTLIACEKTNRACYGLELDPRFADVIIERWCQHTNNRNITKNGEPIVW